MLVCLAGLAGVVGTAVAGDIRGRVEVEARAGGGGPGGAGRPRVFLRGAEMVTPRRSGPLTFERTIEAGRVNQPVEAFRLNDILRFTNRDSLPVILFAFQGSETRSIGPVAPGGVATLVLAHSGPMGLYTGRAGAGEAWLYVAENPFFKEAAADGTFLLDGVPPGRYSLVAWRPGSQSRSQEFEVPYEGSIDVGTLKLK